ncbi:hypothetical protein ACKKBG_A01055 [Auxenochlorella protothecoides x Auxenochlorella symbiontica]
MLTGTALGVLTWGGGASCLFGGFLAVVAASKSRAAQDLGSVREVESLSDLKELASLVPLLVAVSGRVWCARPLTCELSDGEAAIVEIQEEKRTERRFGAVWVGETTPLRASVRETEWCLAEGEGGAGAQVPVLGGAGARGDALQPTGDVFLPAQEGALGALVGELAGHRALGTRVREAALAPGTQLAAVGELAAVAGRGGAFPRAVPAGDGRVLALRAPAPGGGPPLLLSRLPLGELAAALAAEATACRRWAHGFALAGAAALAAAALVRLAAWRRRAAVRRRVEAARRARAAAAAAAAGAGDARGPSTTALPPSPCAVCLDADCAMVFPACGHLCVCEGCGAGLRRCPLCRTGGTPVKVYLS